jgi:hypothetical protein
MASKQQNRSKRKIEYKKKIFFCSISANFASVQIVGFTTNVVDDDDDDDDNVMLNRFVMMNVVLLISHRNGGKMIFYVRGLSDTHSHTYTHTLI